MLAAAFGDPSCRGFMRIAASVAVPGFVKEASAEAGDVRYYSSDIFGDPARRKYPLNNRANTWLSREYFGQDRHMYDQGVAGAIGGRIEKAASYWGLEPSKRLETPEGEYHTVRGMQGEETVLETKVADQGHYKAAAEYLVASKASLTYDIRRSFARGLLAAPAHMRAELPAATQAYLEKAAGFGMGTRPAVNKAIMARVANVHTAYPELSAMLVKAAQALRGTPVTPQVLHKVAGMLDIVDRSTQLHRYYDKGHTTPEEAVYTILSKDAETVKAEAVRLATGDLISKSALLNRKEAVDRFFEEYMGEVPYSSGDEMVAVVGTLPRQDASALMDSVGLAGV